MDSLPCGPQSYASGVGCLHGAVRSRLNGELPVVDTGSISEATQHIESKGQKEALEERQVAYAVFINRLNPSLRKPPQARN